MKLQLSDITIKTPGAQIKEQILEKYGSIKNFADEINLYESSITQYLSSKNLGSSTFKIRTTNAFKKDFNELYKNDEVQIRELTTKLGWYIELYILKEDIEILEKLKMITLEYELLHDYAIVCRAYSHFYMNQGKEDRAKAYIDVALNTVRDKGNMDRYGLYLSDRILFEAEDMSRSEFRKSEEEFFKVLKKVKGPLTTGHMYMNMGRAYYKLGLLAESKKMIEQVFDYHKDARSRGFINIWLGDIEKKNNRMDLALDYYREAEKLLSTEDDLLYYVYDEFASYHFNKGNLKKAEWFVNQIFNDENWKIVSTKHYKLNAFVDIKSACNKESEIVEVINRLLEELKEGYVYNRHHLFVAGEIFQRAKLKDETLKTLGRNIIKFIKLNKLEKEELELSKQLLGSILLNPNFKY